MAKVFGNRTPAAMQAGEAASQMTPATPFSPGAPIGPYDGYNRHPRTHDFVAGYNISARPRSHERVSFDTLKGLIESYDVASMCIWHRIDSIRSLDWSLVAADGYGDDVTDAIPIGMAALKKPDAGDTPFSTWLGEWLYSTLAFDAGSLYRIRNRAGKAIGLRVVDGTSVAPLLDYWGNTPRDPAEAYVQYANGLPWNWLTRSDLIYAPFRKRPDSPYGLAPIETILLNANTDLRFQAYFLQRFCYDEQTEILTRDGWKRFPDVRGDEEYATRSATGEFEWQASKDGKLHVFDSGGTMVEFRNRYVDLLVTPNHRMLTRRKSQGKGLQKSPREWEFDWHIRRADEFLGRCTVDWRLPLTSSWSAPQEAPERFARTVPTADLLGRSATTKVDMPMWAFARFLGVFIAEGHLRHTPPGRVDRWEINVSQMAGGKLDEVRRILKDTGLSWSYWSDARVGRFSVGCKALWLYLEQCGRGAANKVIPDEVLDWPVDLLHHLIDGLMIGDGTVNPSGLPTYITTSRRLADQVQEIWQKCGTYSSVATKAPHPTSFGRREQYHVRARRETEFQMPSPTAVPYVGNVYCVAVPNGIVLVRRNGKTMWCGNTEGNIPAAFASAPETWTPQQIEAFQGYWDAFMLGDQAVKSQIKWLPGGGSIEWSNEHDFSDHFSLFLMRKTAAAYHVVPADLGFTECYSEDTECLTDRGWLRYDEMLDDDRVAAYNPQTREIEYHIPTHRYVAPYEGDLIHFKSRSVDVLVTPHHRMWAWTQTKDRSPHLRPWREIRAEDLAGMSRFGFVGHAVFDAPDLGDVVVPAVASKGRAPVDRRIPMDLWLEFLGYMIAEGCVHRQGNHRHYNVSLSQSNRANPEKVARFTRCLEQLPISWTVADSERDGCRTWTVGDKSLWTWLVDNIGQGSRGKRLPDMFRHLGKRQATILLDALLLGDGTVDNREWSTGREYGTMSSQLASDVQELAYKLGYRVTATCSSIGFWRVNITDGRDHQLGHENVTRKPYSGTVWCVEVPHHLFVTRRNGKVSVQGNTVNRSSGESQADVQHRVGDLPLIKHVDGVLTSFLQDDLGLPLRFAFDLGEEQADRADQASADKVYVEMGAISPSDVREMRYGLPEPEGIPVPRFIYTSRSGPIPLASLYAVAGEVDPSTAAPEPGSDLPRTVFGDVEGVAPAPPIRGVPLAEQIYGPSAMPAAPPPQTVAKDTATAAPTVGITTETGITSYDLVGHHKNDEDDEDSPEPVDQELVKRELARYRSFRNRRRKAGTWRDFEFTTVSKLRAHRLNDAGRLAVRKAAGQVAVAGLAVRAADTGRVLMLQRALDDTDPASGTWEFPGGHLEGDESPLQGAWREWSEETGFVPPPGEQTGSWLSPDGVYQGIVLTVASEACVPLDGDRDQITNPDDPDGDSIEAIAWWDPDQLPGNPAVRPEMLDSINSVMAALSMPSEGDEAVCPCGTPVLFDEMDGWQHADGSVSHDDGESVSDKMRLVKAARTGPKGRGGDTVKDGWPAWHVDRRLSEAFADRIRESLGGVFTAQAARRIAGRWLNAPAHGHPAEVWLRETEPGLAENVTAALSTVLTGLWTTGWAVGTTSAFAVMQGKHRVDWAKYSGVAKASGGQRPGPSPIVDPSLMVYDEASLQEWLNHYGIDSISSISASRMDELAALLESALEDGDSAESLAGEIEGLGAGSAMADMIANTEMARATSQAALASYDVAGVGYVTWLDTGADDRECIDCEMNALADPVPLGGLFPSGVDSAPAHPLCRCAVVAADVAGVGLPSLGELKDILDGFE